MRNLVLEFDKREILEEEIKEHIKFYSQKAEEGMNFFEEGNKKEALNVLREIRKYLKEEYIYYRKGSTQEYIIRNSGYMT